jgi:peptidoglycan/LPS O-acetylase OafA/YrhL
VTEVGAWKMDGEVLIAYFGTVRYWFLSFGFVVYAIMPLLIVLGARCDEEQSCKPTAHFIKAALALSVLALSAYISIFCSICLRVLRPIDFAGEHPLTMKQ